MNKYFSFVCKFPICLKFSQLKDVIEIEMKQFQFTFVWYKLNEENKLDIPSQTF